MSFPVRTPFGLTILILVARVQTASSQISASPEIRHAPRVQEIVDRAVKRTLEQFADKKLEAGQLAATLVDLRDPLKPERGSVRGGEQVYPASVIKLFYLVAANRWMEDGKLADTEELRRAMRDMIVDSYNEATSLIVDSLTDTTSGPELPPSRSGMPNAMR